MGIRPFNNLWRVALRNPETQKLCQVYVEDYDGALRLEKEIAEAFKSRCLFFQPWRLVDDDQHLGVRYVYLTFLKKKKGLKPYIHMVHGSKGSEGKIERVSELYAINEQGIGPAFKAAIIGSHRTDDSMVDERELRDCLAWSTQEHVQALIYQKLAKEVKRRGHPLVGMFSFASQGSMKPKGFSHKKNNNGARTFAIRLDKEMLAEYGTRSKSFTPNTIDRLFFGMADLVGFVRANSLLEVSDRYVDYVYLYMKSVLVDDIINHGIDTQVAGFLDYQANEEIEEQMGLWIDRFYFEVEKSYQLYLRQRYDKWHSAKKSVMHNPVTLV